MGELGPTRQLARFVANTRFDDLPANLVERAKLYVLDNFAAMAVGSVQPWAGMVADTVKALGGEGQASVFNREWRADVSRATLANGAMMGAFESEHIGHTAHPSATVFPAALAIAEHRHATGQALVTAMLLGYEVVCRVGEAQTRGTEDVRGFHNPGVNGAFGAAAAAGKLLELTDQQLEWALGIAGSHACGLVEFVHEGAMTKRLHPGRGSQLGLESALLAQHGFSGPSTVLEGRYGYLQAYSPSPRPERLTAGLGEEWLAADMTIKTYPSHSTSQAVVEAIQCMKRSHPFDPRTIRRIALRVEARATEQRHLDRSPRTVLGAQYSLPFTVAVALARDLSNPYSFDVGVLGDPLILDLAKKVTVEATDSEAEISLDTGDRVDREVAQELRPVDFAGAADKLRRYAAPVIGEARVSEIVDLVSRLDRLPDLRPLARLVAATTVAPLEVR